MIKSLEELFSWNVKEDKRDLFIDILELLKKEKVPILREYG